MNNNFTKNGMHAGLPKKQNFVKVLNFDKVGSNKVDTYFLFANVLFR